MGDLSSKVEWLLRFGEQASDYLGSAEKFSGPYSRPAKAGLPTRKRCKAAIFAAFEINKSRACINLRAAMSSSSTESQVKSKFFRGFEQKAWIQRGKIGLFG